MQIAIIKAKQCIDVAVFPGLSTAREFLTAGVWPDADAVAELPDGYGIGDTYEDGEWTKKPQPPAPEPEEPPVDPLTALMTMTVDQEYRLTLLELGGEL